MTQIRTFTILLAITFGLPWFLLILMPHMSFKNLAAVAYTEDELEFADGSVYPPGGAGRVSNGHDIYTAEGCAYCHTQMIRPTEKLGTDLWRLDWTGRGPKWDGDEGKPVPNRTLRPEDFMGEPVAHLGIQRIGSDLSNYGWRNLTDNEVHQALYSPRSISLRSNMPAYKHLYRLQKIGSAPSTKAISLTGEFAVEDGYEVVPTPRADALVSYLKSLQKDHLVPQSLGGKAPVAAAPAP